MIRLGIAIQQTYQGVQEPEFFNKSDDWSKYVGEVRPYLQFIDIQQKSMLVLRVVRTGILFCSITRMGRGYTDNCAVFLYIPSAAKIGAEGLERIIEKFAEICKADRLDDQSILELTETEYESRDTLEYIPTEQSASKMAVFDTSRGNFGKYLSLAGYQRFNSEYKGVIIAESDESTVNTVDITNKSLDEPITIKPPTVESIKSKWGIEPVQLFVDGKPFTESMTVLKGEKLKVEARHTGCSPVTFKATATTDGATLSLDDAQKFMTDISLKDFKVIDEDGEPVDNFKITANSNDVLGETPTGVQAAEKCPISVEAKGYEGSKTDINPLKPRPWSLSIKKEYKECKGEIELRDGSKGDITLKIPEISIPNLEMYPSELYGYKKTTNNGKQVYAPSKNKSARSKLSVYIRAIVFFFLGLALGIGLTILYMYLFPEEKVTANRQTSSALDYVNENTYFIRGQMEEIPELRGLFDAMNRFDSAAICKPEIERLADASINPPGSQRLLSIMEAIKQNPNPKPKEGAGFTERNYIEVSRYIAYLKSPDSRRPRQAQRINAVSQTADEGNNSEPESTEEMLKDADSDKSSESATETKGQSQKPEG